ncbi:2OG-Fe(II) oxygenase [Sphingobium sp.]|uniref:2OG-Fe(II) oxygenase n=1 Tax=Sphingobium sp. TaxID=1912891 RepID=UPI003B3AAE83
MTSTIVPHAQQLAASGQTMQAVAHLEQGAGRDDVDALFCLATWHLAGYGVARDLPRARDLLHRAVGIGHVDAALMEIALTANGSGAPVDWPGAIDLLNIAAQTDPVAQDQLALIDRMALDRDGYPAMAPSGQPVTAQWDVRLFRNFLSADECHHVITQGAPMMEPAMVIDPRTGRAVPHPIRTSDGGIFGPARENLVIQAINRRIAAASGTQTACGEPLTTLRYGVGQQYRQHHDCLPHVQNQRSWTMLIYLNEGYMGGETVFPYLNVSVKGRKGDALLFRNIDPQGRPAPLATHLGAPVTAGQKWLCTRWIRTQDHDPWASAS